TYVTQRERELATSMIEVSDNDAAEALWETIGGDSGLASANATLGLRHTVGGSGDLWGLTQTTVADQLTLLRAVFGGGGSPLSAASRGYMKSLMTSISDGQRWGVSAADSDAAGYALKNGWLERTATGRWDINSIGMVTNNGHRLLISVLSSGQASEQKGIDLVQAAAAAAAKSFTAGLN
ncbi:Beta-lactamase enzyme family protein, partial [Streptomyces sp. DvalAA-14]|uniref:serine hydrolase n=1 Tax=unclassified Streptomyces TaxID=2593676 RepID=UPI00081BAD3B